jgi:hypothetical protein
VLFNITRKFAASENLWCVNLTEWDIFLLILGIGGIIEYTFKLDDLLYAYQHKQPKSKAEKYFKYLVNIRAIAL